MHYAVRDLKAQPRPVYANRCLLIYLLELTNLTAPVFAYSDRKGQNQLSIYRLEIQFAN